jgi:parvulin-like peptidyl-prolyl isomerase
VKRTLLAGAGAAALLVALSACDTVTPSAAVVNGESISQSSFTDQLRALRDNTAYVASNTGAVAGNGDGNMSTDFSTKLLRFDILYQLIHQEVEKRNLAITPEIKAEAVKEAPTLFSASTDTTETQNMWNGFPASFRNSWVDKTADRLALEAAVSPPADDASLQKIYAADAAGNYTEVCARQIVSATQADAEAVLAKLKGGADFAATAKSDSTDTATADGGGEIVDSSGACPRKSTLSTGIDPTVAKAVLAATPNELTGPVQGQDGWHVFVLEHIQKLPYDKVTDQVKSDAQAQGQEVVSNLLNDGLKSNITVNPRFGRWDKTNGLLLAPAGPAQAPGTPTTTTPATTPASG